MSLPHTQTACPEIVTVVTLLAYGCPVQTIVAAVALDENASSIVDSTKAGGSASGFTNTHRAGGRRVPLVQVRADELRVRIVPWLRSRV